MGKRSYKKFITVFILLAIFVSGVYTAQDRKPETHQSTLGEQLTPTISPTQIPLWETPQVSFSETEQINNASKTPAQVIRVIDGDTLTVLINGEKKTIRLIGINTPETVDPRRPVQCFGKEASNKAKEKLTGQTVYLESDDSQGNQDKYQRLLRYVWLADGTNFNKFMISEGYAYEYTYDLPYAYQEEFKQAQSESEAQKKGLWSEETCAGKRN